MLSYPALKPCKVLLREGWGGRGSRSGAERRNGAPYGAEPGPARPGAFGGGTRPKSKMNNGNAGLPQNLFVYLA